MARRTLDQELARRAAVEADLREGTKSIYRIARDHDVSQTTVRNYRDKLTPEQKIEPAKPVGTPRPAPKPTEQQAYRVGDIVLFEGVRRQITAVYADDTLNLCQTKGVLWSKQHVPADQVTPIPR